MVIASQLNSEEEVEVRNVILSIITLYGGNGLPFKSLDFEFRTFNGYSIPYKKFGCDSLRSFILTLPEIYIMKDRYDNEVLVQYSQKSSHIKDLVSKQKPSRNQGKRKSAYNNYYDDGSHYKRQKPNAPYQYSVSSYGSGSSGNSPTKSAHSESFEQLESMLPLFYKHQALGDDFFLDVADTKMGYYVPQAGPKECGLCVAEQTIAQLTQRVRVAKNLAPRVVVNIGFQDLIMGRNVNLMITEFRELITTLKKRNIRVTLMTLIESPKLPYNRKLHARMDIFNRAILDYACDRDLQCNVLDIHAVFQMEAENFRKDYDRFRKTAKNDTYKVFSDYGRKVFLSSLKYELKKQIEAGL